MINAADRAFPRLTSSSAAARWVVAILLLSGCDRTPSKSTADTTGGGASAEALPQSLFVADAPPEALEVAAAKQSRTVGDVVVVRGRIAGAREPFVDGRAIFTLADFSLPVCSDNPDDKCPTPWDYCCEPKDRVAAHTLTVQVVGPDSKPLKTGFRDAGGLRPMAEVVVKGAVAARQGASFVINASALHVKP